MREVIRDPAKTFRCPRCGAPVTYKGRGRRPVWCSARCRVEASIERRGNEIVGVKPEVVKIVSPTTRVSDWEKERRRGIERNLDRGAVVDPLGLLQSRDEAGVFGDVVARETQRLGPFGEHLATRGVADERSRSWIPTY